MELSPEERQRIFLEEKARIEAQETLKREAEKREAEQRAKKQQSGCGGCLGLIVLLILVMVGFSNPAAGMLTIAIGCVGICFGSFNGRAFQKYTDPKAARTATIVLSAVLLALGGYGMYWQNSTEGKAHIEQVERRSRQIRETEDLPRDVQKDIDNEYHRSGNTSRRH